METVSIAPQKELSERIVNVYIGYVAQRKAHETEEGHKMDYTVALTNMFCVALAASAAGIGLQGNVVSKEEARKLAARSLWGTNCNLERSLLTQSRNAHLAIKITAAAAILQILIVTLSYLSR